MANTISIQVLGEVSGIKKSLTSVESQLGGFGKSMGKVGTLLKGALAGVAIGKGVSALTGFLKDATRAGSELQQSTGAVDAVFGRSAGSIKKAAAGAAQSFGLSKNAYQELASVIGAGLKNKGIKDFGSETQKVIGIGADLAAQFGGSTKEAVEAIGSLMRGETDPIEKYGVGINESAIAAELAAKGQSKLTGASLEQAKTQARLRLLFKQTSDAQGAFGRESDTLAGKQARNAAAWENLKAKLGTVLLPVLTQVQTIIAEKVLPVVERFFDFIAKNAPAAIEKVQKFLAGLKGDGTAASYFDTVKQVLGTVWQVLKDIGTQVAANWPTIREAIVSAVTAIQAAFAAFRKFWDAWGPTISAVVGTAFATAVTIISGAMQVIAGVIRTVLALLTGDWSGAWEGIKAVVSGSLTIVKALIGNLLNQALSIAKGIIAQLGFTFDGGFSAMWNLVKAALGNIVSSIRDRLTDAKQAVVNAWNSIKGTTSTVWTSIKTAVSTAVTSVLSAVSSKITQVKSTVTSGWSAVKSLTTSAWNTVKSTVTGKVSEVLAKIKTIPGVVKGAFSSAGSWLVSAGRKIIDGLVSGIRSAIGRVRSLLNSVTDMIPDWKGPAEKDARLLTNAGELIMGSLVKGFENGQANVRSSLQDVTRFISKSLDTTMSPTLSPTVSLKAASATLSGFGTAGVSPAATTYNITVTAPVGASPADIGRELVSHIDAYQRAGGRSRA